MIGTVDIHSHIIPAVDDGAVDLDEALDMLKIAVKNGTSDIVATPHYLADNLRCAGLSASELKARFDVLKEAAAKHVPDINLHFGAEMYSVGNIESVIKSGNVISIDNNGYVLVEFAFNDSPKRALEIVRVLQTAGYNVVIAHPERYVFVKDNPRLIVPFLETGALLQINPQSILGDCDPVEQDVALSFLENSLAAVVASDSHSVFKRSPDMSDAYSFVFLNFSPDYAERLFHHNPKAIINGEKLYL